MLTRRRLFELGLPAGLAALVPRTGGAVKAGDDFPFRSPSTSPFRVELPVPPPAERTTIDKDQLIALLRAQEKPLPQRDLDEEFEAFIRHEASDEIDLVDLEMREAWADILPGYSTLIWGYNGTTPSATIYARAGRTTVVCFTNNLPEFAGSHEGTVIHLHGGHMPPEWDGFADEFMPFASSRYYIYPNKQRAGTLWFHDHGMDITGPNVYAGLAGFYLLTDAFEEDLQHRLVLPDPRYELPLVFQDRLFDAEGQLFYDAFDHDGFLGDTFLVNGAVQPYCRVEPRRYRLRLLNGSNARYYELAFNRDLPFVQIGADSGGLLPAAATRRSIRLAMAERVDVVVDFAKFAGQSVVLNNILEQDDGRGPDDVDRSNPTPLVRFDVTVPMSAVPDCAPVNDKMPLRPLDAPVGPIARRRTFEFERKNGAWAINDRFFDPRVSDAVVRLGDIEVWSLVNKSGGWEHPVHIHDVPFLILERNGRKPPAWEAGWKDTVNLGPNDTVRVMLRFDDYVGKYLYHCHNVEHEDMRMMGRFDVVPRTTA